MSQDNEFNQGDGLKGHWHDVLAAEGSLLTACGQHTSKADAFTGRMIATHAMHHHQGQGPGTRAPEDGKLIPVGGRDEMAVTLQGAL